MQNNINLILIFPVETEVLRVPVFYEGTDILINGKEVEILIFSKK